MSHKKRQFYRAYCIRCRIWYAAEFDGIRARVSVLKLNIDYCTRWVLLIAASDRALGKPGYPGAPPNVIQLNANRLSLALQNEGHKYERTNNTLYMEKNCFDSDWCRGSDANLNLEENCFVSYENKKEEAVNVKYCSRSR